MNHLVSVILPTFNRPHYLKQAIQSVLDQTYSNLELLVIDDASTAETYDVVKLFQHDKRLRYIRNDREIWCAACWKLGFELISGDFFSILHDDNFYHPDFIESLIKPHFEEDGIILSFADAWSVDSNSERLPDQTEKYILNVHHDTLDPGSLKSFVEHALIDYGVPVEASLFRRNLVDSSFFEPRAKGASDMWLLYRCCVAGFRAFYVKERLLNFRNHSENLSSSTHPTSVLEKPTKALYMLEGTSFYLTALVNEPLLKHYQDYFLRKQVRSLTRLVEVYHILKEDQKSIETLRTCFYDNPSVRNIKDLSYYLLTLLGKNLAVLGRNGVSMFIGVCRLKDQIVRVRFRLRKVKLVG